MHRISSLALALVLAAGAWALGAAPARAADAPSPGAASDHAAPPGTNEIVSPEATTLKNGLRVLSLTDPHAAVASFQVWYDTGSRNERPGVTGVSQVLEAMMFRGTKTVGPDEFVRRLQAVGGLNDAQTTWDVTSYWETLLPEQLDLAARLEADRMANLALTPANLDSARAAVFRTRRQTVDGSPAARGLELLTSLAYDSSPYRWPTLGWPQDVTALTLEDVKDYYATHYTPDKALVVIAGPTTHAANVRLVEKWFGGLKAGPKAPRVAEDERPQFGQRQGTLEAETPVPILLLGYKSPADSSADGPVMDVIARIVSGGPASRLSKNLVEGAQSAYFATAFQAGRKDVGLFYAAAGLKSGHERDSLAAGLENVLESLAHDPVSEDELARAQNQLETQFWFGLDTMQDRASAIAGATLIDGDPAALARRIGRWRAVTSADVLRVARAYFRPQHRTLVWVQQPSRSGS